jgi:hypothetical protein
MSIRSRIDDWDCLFFEKDKNNNQFFAYAVSRGYMALPATVVGIELSMAVQAICQPTSQNVLGAGIGAGFALAGIGMSYLGLVMGASQRRMSSGSSQLLEPQ